MVGHLVLTVLHDLVIGLFVLFCGLLHLDGVDLHAEQLGCEPGVELEAVVVADLLTLQHVSAMVSTNNEVCALAKDHLLTFITPFTPRLLG